MFNRELNKTLKSLEQRITTIERELDRKRSDETRYHNYVDIQELKRDVQDLDERLKLYFWEDVLIPHTDNEYTRSQVPYSLRELVQLILDEMQLVPRVAEEHLYLLDKEEADAK